MDSGFHPPFLPRTNSFITTPSSGTWLNETFMNPDQRLIAIGAIVSHLLALEFLMRQFIQKKSGEGFKPHYFGDVLSRYNRIVGQRGALSETLVELRNGFGHGLIASKIPDGKMSATLIKYKKGTREIEYKKEMTDEWLKKEVEKTKNALMKVAMDSGTEFV